MRNVLRAAVGAIALLAAGAAVSADRQLAEGESPFSYGFVEAAYLASDFDDIDETADGFGLRFSADVAEHVFLLANFSQQTAELSGVDVDLENYSFGVGAYWPFAERFDFYGTLEYVNARVEALNQDVDDNGWGVSVGLRALLGERVEAEGAIAHSGLSDFGNETSLNVALRWWVLERLALGVEGTFSDEANGYGVEVRWSFD